MIDFKQFWFKAQAIPQDDGVMITIPDEPLSFVWQTRQQAEEIVRRLQAAIHQLGGDISPYSSHGFTADQAALAVEHARREGIIG